MEQLFHASTIVFRRFAGPRAQYREQYTMRTCRHADLRWPTLPIPATQTTRRPKTEHFWKVSEKDCFNTNFL
jgi:hypothetical protein